MEGRPLVAIGRKSTDRIRDRAPPRCGFQMLLSQYKRMPRRSRDPGGAGRAGNLGGARSHSGSLVETGQTDNSESDLTAEFKQQTVHNWMH